MNDIFDPKSVLSELGGEKELLKEMAEIFLSIYPEDMGLIRNALEKNDFELIRSSAHRMKGSVANFGKNRAFLSAKNLEDAARSNDMVEIKRSYDDLQRNVMDLELALKEYCLRRN